MSKWTKGECRIVVAPEPGTERQATAWTTPCAPGLAVTLTPPVGGLFAKYTITHVPSGRAITKWFPKLSEAQRGVLALAGLTDWNVPAAEIAKVEKLGNKVRDALLGAEAQ